MNSIVDAGNLLLCRENVFLRASTASISRGNSLCCKDGFFTLAFEKVQYALLIKAVEPGTRGFGSKTRQFHGPHCRRQFCLAFKPVASGIPFVTSDECLRKADRTHGHEIVGQAVAHRTSDRQIVDREPENRVGQTTRRHRPFAG